MTMDNRKNNSRPFKMQNWVVALKEVLTEEDILFLTDKDLVFLVNQRLPKEDCIASPTFENWKAGKFHPNEEIGNEFIEAIHNALIKQKQVIGKKLLEDTSGQWTRYAWLMERKFSEWNLKKISENINRNEQVSINITAGSNEQKALIESIMNVDAIEVKPLQLEPKKEVKPHNTEENELPF